MLFGGKFAGDRIPESLRLWLWSKSHGDFSHLPAAGGIYDQHPVLVDEWMIINSAWAEHQENEEKKQKLRERAKSPRR